MDGETFREELADAKSSELDHLDSEGLLLALTDGVPRPETVLDAAANSEYAAAETFGQWADDEDHDAARDAFARVVAQEEEHYVRVTDHLDDHDPPDAPGPMHAYLRAREGTIERVATGMVARPMVSVRSHGRVIDFFADRGDEAEADLFRDLESDTADVIDDGLELLELLCEDGDDRERARMTAEYTIRVAHDDVADALRSVDFDSDRVG